MRLSFVGPPAVATIAVAFVAGSVACSGGTVDFNPGLLDGGTQLGDGAVVGPDGDIVNAPDGSSGSKVNATNETVAVSGTTRSYVLAVPRTYDAARMYPLIIALHGDGQDGPSFRAFLTLDDVAGDDAIVAYPTGAEDLFTPYDQNPDQLLVEATINDVKAKRSVDAARVWGFGYSKGGFIANEIACRKPGVLKAMAIHAGGAPLETRGPDGFPLCPGVLSVPVIETGGDLDPDVGGDLFGANYWAKVDGCGTGQTTTTPAACQTFDACPAGKPVVYCLAPGVSHYPIWNQAVDVSWAFFKSL